MQCPNLTRWPVGNKMEINVGHQPEIIAKDNGHQTKAKKHKFLAPSGAESRLGLDSWVNDLSSTFSVAYPKRLLKYLPFLTRLPAI